MANFPKSFTPVTGQVLATYNFSDLQQNLGYLTLYGATAHDGTNLNYILTNNSNFGSHQVLTTLKAATGTLLTSTNFDGLFNTTMEVKGTILISIPFHMTNGNGNTVSVTITLDHVKAVGGTDTIGTGTVTSNGATSGTMLDYNAINTMNIDNADFIINDGDIIRLTVSATVNGTGSPTTDIFYDPLNRTAARGNATSQLKVSLPTPIL